MAEELIDVRGMDKPAAYTKTRGAITSVLEGIEDPVAGMATIASVLHHGFGFLWTGFYRAASPSLLRVGPYQGTVGCMEIPVGRGVCGTAAAERRTVIVDDVARFPGHIACDARARSEIVVPVFDAGGSLLAVLDIDSAELNTFDRRDQDGLESIVGWFGRLSLPRA